MEWLRCEDSSNLYVFDLLIQDLIKPRKFNCVAAVSHGIYQIRRGICQILPRKTVGPNDYYSRISALCPEGHCTSCFKRVMYISCRRHVDIHKGVGVASCGLGIGGVKNRILLCTS